MNLALHTPDILNHRLRIAGFGGGNGFGQMLDRTGEIEHSVGDARQLEVNLYRYEVGQKVSLQLLRGSQKLTYSVTVVERDNDPQR